LDTFPGISFNVAESKINRRKSKITAAAWGRIRLFAMDVDGILTDGTVTVRSDGTEAKTFSILDGMGLVRCREAGITLAWISGRASAATELRARELKIPHVVQGRSDKLAALQELAGRLGCPSVEVCYMGDDEIDVPALKWAGIGATVSTAIDAALAVADYVAVRPAGRGAVREVCDRLLAASE
jgi:3-deoxy-D-manno-octulosonate 8-phosphate phosphatase (KDO 8-P phosphatase)